RTSVFADLDVGVTLFAFCFSVGADNTIAEVRSRSDLCARPKNRVFQNRGRTNATTGAYRIKTKKTSAGIDRRVGGHVHRPLSWADIIWFPALLLDDPMDFEIFGAGANVEPVAIVQNNAAYFYFLPNPFCDY